MGPVLDGVEEEDKEIRSISIRLQSKVYSINTLLTTSVNLAQKLRQDIKMEYQHFKVS